MASDGVRNQVTRRIFNTDIIFLSSFYSQNGKKLALVTVFNTILWLYLIVAYFLGHPVHTFLLSAYNLLACDIAYSDRQAYGINLNFVHSIKKSELHSD